MNSHHRNTPTHNQMHHDDDCLDKPYGTLARFHHECEVEASAHKLQLHLAVISMLIACLF
jgi:hypothetical protein